MIFTILGGLAAAAIGYGASKLFNRKVDDTAERISRMREFDETNFHQVVDISGAFASIQVEAEREFQKLEDCVVSGVEKLLNDVINNVSVNTDNLNKYLISEAKVTVNNIKGTLSFYLKRRYTIDNSELVNILKLDEGESKRIYLKDYLNSSLEEGKKHLIEKIKNELSKFIEIIDKEIQNYQNLRIEQFKKNLDELDSIIKIKESESEELKEKILPNKFNIILFDTVTEIFK